MLKKLLFLTMMTCVTGITTGLAQEGSVTGTVTDASSGETLPGVNVLLTELEQGTATNNEGNYTIDGVPAGTYTLRATFVGFQQYEAQVKVGEGQEATHNIEMAPDVVGLSEVVVNALGFEEDRDRSALSTSNISGQQIAESGTDNLLSGLSAKAAGVRITQSTGDPGAGAYTLIRGQSTITGETEPLFVIDGVPISNANLGSGIAGVAQQSRANDINPEDIESVEVLKGSSAAALWGTRAANGVVVIRTKSGSRDGGLNVSLGSQYTRNEINESVPLQRTFGQGVGGEFNPASVTSWGDRIADRPGGEDVVDQSGAYAVAPDGEEFYPVIEKNSTETYDHSEEVFGTGHVWENNLSVSGGDETSSYYLSVSNLNNQGIIRENSNYDRTSVRANLDRTFSAITFSTNINYIRSTSDRIQQGSNISGLFLGGLRTPPDFNNQSATTVDFIDENGLVYPDRQRSYRNPIGALENPGFDNPFWTIDNVRNSTTVNRFLGNIQVSYDPTSWLNITNRTGLDTYQDRRFELFPVYNASQPSGELTEQDFSELQINNDFIVRATRQFTSDYSGSLLAGFNFNHREFDNVGATVRDFILPDAPRDLANSVTDARFPFQDTETVRTAALYGEAKLSVFDMLFLTVTGRGESASTFGSETSSTFFYPSASVAWQFTQLGAFEENNILSFGKLRASYGTVGRQPDPYLTVTDYVGASFGTGWGPTLDAAAYNGGYVQSATQGNAELKPERKTEFEIGTDLRFFNDRVSLSGTYYTNKTEDAIFAVDVAASTGFTGQIANAAELENEGVEIEFDIGWLRNQNFSWNTYGNWSINENVVTDLRGTTSIFLSGFAGASSRAVEGEAVGALWGGRWSRNEDGSLNLDGSGFPQLAVERGVIGDPNPDWTAGIGNVFNYRFLSLDVLFDIKYGGDIWNGTKGALYTYGTHADTGVETTAEQDLVTYAGDIISAGETFRGRVEDFGGGPVALDESWYSTIGGGFGPVEEQFIVDGGFVRLREVGVTYSLATQGFQNTTGLSSVDLSVRGLNLYLWTDYEGIDPETNLTGPTNGRGLDYFQNPSTRSFIFSVRVNY